jgi:hypothetical protein
MSSQVDFQAAMILAQEVDPFSREARRAFVAPRAATFRTIRMYQMARGDDSSIAVFRTMAEAKHCLSIEHPYQERRPMAEHNVRCPDCMLGNENWPLLQRPGWLSASSAAM